MTCRLGAFDAQADPCVALARYTVENYIAEKRIPALPANLPASLVGRRAGAFVSLHRRGKLRGCIGTMGPTRKSLADEIVQNAISASTRDPRFPEVRPDELDEIEYSVDVLGELESIYSPDDLDAARYGVMVSKGRRRGVLLPNLEGIDTVQDQLFIAKRKAGINPADGDVDLSRFEVARHERGGEPRRRS